MSDDRVRAQYEAYPYPERDPADEARRLFTGTPSHLVEINHYVFGGRLDMARPFRVLVAGGGTGDGIIMLAQQLAWAGSPAEIVYLDVSAAALAVAEARAEARKLRNVRFLQGSLLDLPKLGLGQFDYIDCCGVIHHLAEPEAGLRALVAALADDGGLGMMLYGEIGRTGVYHMQAMLRLLAPGDDGRGRLGLARRLCDDLPETNWFRRNTNIADHLKGGDAGLYDLLLHSRDRAYTVPQLAALVDGAGLEITGFIEPALYDPTHQLRDPEIRARAAALPWIERCAVAELLAGTFKRHVFYAVKAGRADAAVARPDNAQAVPCLREGEGAEFARRLTSSGRIKAEFEGVKMTYDVSPLGTAILALVDSRRNLGEIHRILAKEHGSGLDWLAFKGAFDRLYATLNALNVMLISYRRQKKRT